MSDMTGLPPVDPQVAEGPQGSTGPDLPMMTTPIDAPPPIERVPVRGYSSSQFPTDPYLQQQEAQRRQQDDLSVMMRIRQAITEGDADAVAEAERLSLKTGLTISSIRENANTARGIAAALDARDARYGESNPVLYLEMMDPLFASTAADDVRNLSWYERLGKGFDRGQLMVEQGQLAWKLMRSGQLSEPESAKLTEITRQMDAYAFDDGMWALTGETVGQMSQTMPVALGAGAVAAGLVGAVTGGSGAAPTFAAVTGLVGYSQTAEIEGGLAFLQYKRSGMDHRTAVTNATMVGRINGLVEMLPLGTVGGQFAKAGRNFARRGASQIASKKGMRGAVRRMMAQRTAKRSWSNTAKNWALGTAAEVSAEMVQETVTALGEYYGQVDTQALRTAQVGEVAGDFNMPGGGTIRTLPDGTVQVSNEILDIVDGVIPIGSAGRRANEFHTLTPQQAQEVIADLDRIYPLESVLHDETMAADIIKLTSDTAWSALKGMWLVGAAGPLMQHASERAQVKKSEIDHQVFADNVDKASDSKLNKRSPSAFARFWQLQAEEGDDSVYISRTDLDEKMSSNGITIDDLEQVFPGIKDQYGLDPDSHPDIEIPKGEAVAKFANNQLFDIFKDVLRTNQEAISQRDLEQMEPNIEAQKKVLEAQLAEDEQVVDARDTELDVIEEAIANQLVAAGTKLPMARVQAAWARSYVAVRALAKTKQLGRQVLPSEIRIPRIISEALYEQGQDQGDNLSQGDERIIDEASGLPINDDGTVSVYHHTDRASADLIRSEGILRSKAEPDVYVTTRKEPDTGYGDTSVEIRVRPELLQLDDEFPDGRRDFRIRGDADRSVKVSFPQDENFDQIGDYEFDEGDYRPAVVTWAKDRFGDRVAPNGKPTWQNYVVWFGDSQVIDESGAPLDVYHATSVDFVAFSPGSHFGSKEAAQDRAAVLSDRRAGPIRTIPVLLNVRNPLRIKDNGLVSPGDVKQAAIEAVDAEAANRLRAVDVVLGDGERFGDQALGYAAIYEALEREGFDGLVYRNTVEGMGDDSYVAFRPTQIKSVNNRGTFDSRDPNLLRQDGASSFVSALSTEVDALNTKSATAEGWKQALTGLVNDGKVKAAEIDAVGLTDWLDLQAGKVSKEDLQAFIANNGVSVETVTLDESPKFGSYTLPGGENYREVLLTLPEKTVTRTYPAPGGPYEVRSPGNLGEEFYIVSNVGPGSGDWGDVAYATREEAEAAIPNLPERVEVSPDHSANFNSTHFDEPNIVAHLRLNDRTDADGKRVLFVEEVQSDWAQEGRKRGFAADAGLVRDIDAEREQIRAAMAARKDELAEDIRTGVLVPPDSDWGVQEAATEDDEYSRLANELDSMAWGNLSPKVPLAPFVTNTKGWLNLALKKVMQLAVDGGYERVAFIDGKQSAERYDLSKQVDSIEVNHIPEDGKYPAERTVTLNLIGQENPFILDVKPDGTVNGDGVDGKNLDEVVGKEMAERIMLVDGDKTIRGQDLRVGGEGMISFYDKIVPAALDKLVKKTGGKTGKADLGDGLEGQLAFDVTEQMSENVRAGLALFSKEGTVTRGSFDKRTGQIIIGRDHNGSTFFHEWGHFHLQVLIEDVAAGTATEQDIKDLETIAKWGGHASAQAFIDASPAAHRATHEAWAAAFEQYLYENKADSAEMRSVFRRVADLLIESWRQIKRIGENYQRIYGQPLPVMNPEITAVMDRLMMTDDQITTRMQQDAVSKLLNGVEVTPEEQATLDDLYFDQESEAKEELRKRFMKQLRKLRSFRGRELKRLQSASRKARKEAEENARDTLLREEPRARLVHWLTTGELIEFAPDGEMIVREKLADTAKIATTDPRVPKKFRRLSPELAEDMQLEAELELIEAEEVLAEEEPVLLERIEGLKAEIANDQELRKAVKAEQRVVRKSGNKALLEENEGVIADAEARIDNSKEAVKTAQDELREWKRLAKSAQTAVNRAKAVTMKASDPARQVDDGIDPKFLADKFGFDSVDDVLTGTEFDLEEETHQAADKLMEDESPELASTEGIQTAVSEAVNNEALLRVRSSELSVLDKTGPSQSLLMATAKMVAKRVVEGRLFRELATHEDETPAQLGERRNRHAMGLGRKFEIAARKAERDARSARDARDLEAMRKHQRTALQQRALSAEAYSQRDKLRKDMDRITSILKVSGAKRESQLARAYGGAAVESARMMLLAVGLGDEAMARRIAGLSINGQFDPAENSPLSDGDKAELTSAVNAAKAIGTETGGDYKRMEIGTLREFLVGIDGVLNMARRLRQIQIGDQTVMIEDLAESLKQQADAEGRVIPDNQQKEKENIARRQLGPMNEKWQRMEALLYAMDGNKYGTLTQAIWQPIADSVNRLNEDEVRILNKFKDIVRPLREAVRGDQDLADEITAEYLIDPGTGKPFVFRQGKLGIIGALVHSGSDSNLKRLVHGWKWGLYDAETDTLDRSAWDAQVAAWEASGMVTEADWQMVQAIWDLYDEMLPAMRRAHYDALGFDMVLTERTPVQTRWGEFKGGYVPAALDRDKQPVRQDVRDANEILEAQKQMPTVARGMTQGRVNYDFRALDLDILRQVEHFHKHLMFTHLAAPAKQLLSIVYNDDVNVQLERLYPGFTQNHLKHWIETVTTQSSTLGQHQDIDGAASLWNVLRRNTGSAAMIGNIRNALQGIGGIALAAARVRPRYLMLAAHDYFQSPYRSRDAIQDKSRMMRLRHVKGNNIYEVRDAINELHESGNAFIRNTDKLRAFLAKHTYIAQELIQKPLDRIVWLGAYKQAVDAGKSEIVAIREADGAVRQTQHDSTPMSLASGEKGTPLQKLVSQFMGWFVMMASLRGGDFHNQTRLSALMLVLGPMLTTMVIGEIVSEMLDEHEKDDTWDKIALRVAGNSVFSLPRAFGIPGVIASTALQSSVGSALGTAENYQMRMPQPAAFALVGRAMAAGRQWVDAMTSESSKASIADAGTDFIEIVGALFGIPIGVVTNRVQAGFTDEDASVRGFINGR